MSLIRFILLSLFFYLIIKTVSNVRKYLFSTNKSNNIKVDQKPSKYNIDTKDIIDAHFEEIGSKTSEKSKENS